MSLKLFVVAQNETAGICMRVIPWVDHYAVDCAWVTVSFVLTRWQWNRRASTSQLTLQLCIPRWSPIVCKIYFEERRRRTLQGLLFGHPSLILRPTTSSFNAVSNCLECSNGFHWPWNNGFPYSNFVIILQINFVFTFVSVVRKFCRLFAVLYPVYCVLAIFS